MTPEGRVKVKVKQILKDAGAYWHCPVQNGMGSPALDFMHVIYKGSACAIETKAPGEQPTARQWLTIAAIQAAGGTVLVIDGTNYEELHKWLLRAAALTTSSGS